MKSNILEKLETAAAEITTGQLIVPIENTPFHLTMQEDRHLIVLGNEIVVDAIGLPLLAVKFEDKFFNVIWYMCAKMIEFSFKNSEEVKNIIKEERKENE